MLKVALKNLAGHKLRTLFTAVAVALDGHRIALVVDGAELFVAPLVGRDRLAVGAARQLFSTLTDLAAVDWNAEDSLVLAGRNGNEPGVVYKLRVDGTGETTESNPVDEPITHLAAYPDNPTVRASGRGNVLYGTRSKGYAEQKPIVLAQIEGPPVDATPVSPSAPTAPFFLY